MKTSALLCLLLLAGLTAGHAADPGQTWTDPEKAATEHPDFLLQGEYLGNGTGVQVADMNEGRFLVTTYPGGLPGAGWDGANLISEVLERDRLQQTISRAKLKRVERDSPAAGRKAPVGATVIFDGESNENVKGVIKDRLLWAGAETTRATASFSLHLEFRLPFKPDILPSSQSRGNSGVYIFNNYECQVLDSFALPLDAARVPFKVQSDPNQWCGSLYKTRLPDVPMCYPPLRWQTYDIDFTAPVFEGDRKLANARFTVRLNGILVHNDVELEKGTGAGGLKPEKAMDRIYFQGHGNPVAFRNVWLVEK